MATAMAAALLPVATVFGDMWGDFVDPPDSAKPWAYYLWQNGLADRESITADLEAMKRLGFGGINMVDTRGYWDDEDHVVIPKAEMVWGSTEWYGLVELCIRECARLGLEFTMNCAASGGSMISYVDGRPYEADVLDRADVVAHLDRALGPILKRVPDLVGKTFTHIYSVSYEGNVKTGGSCFVVFAPAAGSTTESTETPLATRKSCEKYFRVREAGSVNSVVELQITNVWQVSFAYHDGISAAPPAPVTMETLRDWTTYGRDGEADSTFLRYFSGTATYRTTFSCFHNATNKPVFSRVERADRVELLHVSTRSARLNISAMISLGELPSGLAHVFVNGKDCGVVWCAPWEADVSRAVRDGENEIEIRYTNNWYNRLVGDCFLKPEERVTRSTLRYSEKPRAKSDPKRPWFPLPSIYSGPAVSDRLQPSGLLGPVMLKLSSNK